MNIQYLENDKLDNNFKEFISSIDEKDVENIGMNKMMNMMKYLIIKLGFDYDKDKNYFVKY